MAALGVDACGVALLLDGVVFGQFSCFLKEGVGFQLIEIDELSGFVGVYQVAPNEHFRTVVLFLAVAYVQFEKSLVNLV